MNNDVHEFILDSGTVANNRVIFQIFLPSVTWEFFIFFPLVHGNIPWGFYRKSEQFPWLFTTVQSYHGISYSSPKWKNKFYRIRRCHTLYKYLPLNSFQDPIGEYKSYCMLLLEPGHFSYLLMAVAQMKMLFF
jgi:hypothetical protein